MRHRNKKRILNRPADQRKALVRSLVTALFTEGSIRTTSAKAKALQAEAEKLITKVRKQDTPHMAIRELMRVVYTEKASRNALEFANASKRPSGFVRCVKLGQRVGDGAEMTQVQLITD